MLGVVLEEVPNPLECTASQTIKFSFQQQPSVGDLVKCLGEIEQDQIDLLLLFETSSQVIDGLSEEEANSPP